MLIYKRNRLIARLVKHKSCLSLKKDESRKLFKSKANHVDFISYKLMTIANSPRLASAPQNRSLRIVLCSYQSCIIIINALQYLTRFMTPR